MNSVANRQVICDVLLELALKDRNVIVLTSDSRGSASMIGFAEKLPEQFIEVGIAEQNIVGIAAGLAASGKKPYVASPACFLSLRSIEQIKMDVAYSGTNVKLIGISGGISYGALGMSHHSLQDIAVMRAIPGINIMLPADRIETKKMIETVYKDTRPAYIRIGRNAVPDVLPEAYKFEVGKAVTMQEGMDITLIGTGEAVKTALDASILLKQSGISCKVLNMHTLKPFDQEAVIKAAKETGHIITIEEHSIYGGLGSAVSEAVAQNCCASVKILGIPDEPAIPGKSSEVFEYYGITPLKIKEIALSMLYNN